jgi:hypothetical protein
MQKWHSFVHVKLLGTIANTPLFNRFPVRIRPSLSFLFRSVPGGTPLEIPSPSNILSLEISALETVSGAITPTAISVPEEVIANFPLTKRLCASWA